MKLQEGTNVSQVQSNQIECEALLHALSATDKDPWCFVSVGSGIVQWQSEAFRKLWKTGVPKGPISAVDDATGIDADTLQMLIANSQTKAHVTINDQDWTAHSSIVMNNTGHPAGRLVRLFPATARVENGAMILASHDAQRRLTALSPRESEILELVYEGLTNKAIAARTNISQKTVEKHRGRVSKKLHTSGLAELVRLVAIARYTDSAPANEVASDGAA